MNSGFEIGRVRGIPVRVNWSVFVVVALIAWNLGGLAFPQAYPGHSSAAYLVAGVAAAAVFLASLLTHEIGHAILALRYGVGVRSLTLWLFGGVAHLEGEAQTPREALRIAGVGPAISAVLGVALGLAAYVTTLADGPVLLFAVLAWTAWMNVVLAVFNLAPALPLDGGRVLQAVLWRRGGDRRRATRSAARAGTVFGYLLMGLGLAQLLAGRGVGGFWLLFLGWFLVGAARAEVSGSDLRAAVDGVLVEDVMARDPVAVPAGISVQELVDSWMRRLRFTAYPVVLPDGSLLGLVTTGDLERVPRDRWPQVPVGDVARRLDAVPVTEPGRPLGEVLDQLDGAGRVLVVDGGRLAGIVTSSDVMRAVEVARLAGPRPEAAARELR